MGIKVKKDINSTAKKEILLSKENAKTIQLLEFEHFFTFLCLTFIPSLLLKLNGSSALI